MPLPMSWILYSIKNSVSSVEAPGGLDDGPGDGVADVARQHPPLPQAVPGQVPGGDPGAPQGDNISSGGFGAAAGEEWEPVPSISLDDFNQPDADEEIPEARPVAATELGMGEASEMGDLADGADLLAPVEGVSDLPQPFEGLVDLPQPKEGLADLPQPKADPLADLPAPKMGLQGTQMGMGDPVADLPIPREGIVDLPEPKGGISDLMEPKGGIADVPEPAGGIADFPEPADGIADFPEPAGGIADFPEPAGGIADFPEPADGISDFPEPSAGISDFPEPSGGISDFPEPQDGISDLPEPDGGIADFPEPQGLEGFFEYSDDAGLDDGGAFADLDGVPDMPEGDAVVGDQPINLDSGAAGDELHFDAPSEADVEEMTDLAHEPAVDEKVKQPRKKRPMTRMDYIRIAVLSLVGVLLVGIGMGLFTDYGFFGLHYLTGGFEKERKAKEDMATMQREMGKDTFSSYRKALRGLESVAKVLSENPDPMALQVQAVSAMLLRFGANKARKTKATEMLTGLRQADADSKEVDKATALVMAFLNKHDKAIATINKVIARDRTDAVAKVYEGWIYERGAKYDKATKSYEEAVKLDAKLPAALYGLAHVQELTNKNKEAFAGADKTLKANPLHTGAMLLKARLLLGDKKLTQVKAILEEVAKQDKLAAPVEQAEAASTLGQLGVVSGSSNEARKHFQKALKLNPDNVTAMLGLGNLNYQAKMYKDALKQFRAARKLNPNNVDASFMIARTVLAQGKPMDALKALMAIGRGAKGKAELPYLLGRVEEELGEFKDAEKHYREAMKLKPKFFKPYLHLSRIFMKQNEQKKALEVLRTAQKKIPKSGVVLNAQGEIYLAGKHLKKALSKFQRALRKDPNLNLAIFNMANTLFELGNMKKARKRYEELQKRDNKFPGLAAKMADLMTRLEDHAAASKQWDIALKQEKPTLERRIKAARSYVDAGYYKKALTQTELALRQDASIAEAKAIRAEALLATNELGDALVEIKGALDREQLAKYFVTLGRVLLALHKELEAIDAYTSALKRDPSLVAIQAERAILLVKNGTVKDGLKQLRKVVSSFSGRADIHFWMGWAYYDLGEENKALTAFRTAAAKDASMGQAHYRIALILYDRRKLGSAVPLFKRAIKTYKEVKGKQSPSWYEDSVLQLGFIYEKQRLRKQAIETYKKYLEVANPHAAMRQEVTKRLKNYGVNLEEDEF